MWETRTETRTTLSYSQSPWEKNPNPPKSKAHLPLFLHKTEELSHQYGGAILSYFQKLQKKAETKFSNCGYTKPQLLVHTLWALVWLEENKKQKTSSVPVHIPKKRFIQCSGQQEVHPNLGKEQLQIQWLCSKMSQKKPLQMETTIRISKNKSMDKWNRAWKHKWSTFWRHIQGNRRKV